MVRGAPGVQVVEYQAVAELLPALDAFFSGLA
jgi:hypothetical protein